MGEGEIGDLVPSRELTEQVPRPQLSALVERQQQIRLQPQNAKPRHDASRASPSGRTVAENA